ncbi:hypothetical protein [Asanoa siamensis]|uniref:Uncharacterized protein n=1 Tax=Asanoa siamensis TaxID=926357 RepID=A0ABQ4CVZ7_9ACTN|nr:hypothetical protein [Asanoa siamensis]GIF75476.1 hypothetical protein Asi02nite_49940 [Asanoa siamensis]
MTDLPAITVEADLTDEAADREIESAIKGRQAVARRYVRWVRRRNPDATPAEVVRVLERHYVTAISVAGGLVTAGTIALDVGIALIPIAGAAATGAKSAAREAGKSAAKKMAREAALGATRLGAQHVAKMLPAGDEQLQFEITALYALALADIHGMTLDQAQARALVYGLSNGRVGQGQIAAMAADLARSSSLVDVGKSIATGQRDWSHWAETLAHSLPAGAAQELVRGVQTGRLEDVRTGLGAKGQTAVEYGVGALVGGVTRFVFGRAVVDAAHEAFAAAPAEFPAHLEVDRKTETDGEPNRALTALQDAARATGSWVGSTAQTIETAAGAVTRPFRSVDLDGDGVPDEPQALTAVKGVGGAIAGAATSVAGVATSAASSAAGTATGAIAGAATTVAGAATSAAGTATGALASAATTVAGAASSAAGAATGAIAGAASSVAGAATSVAGAASSAAGAATGAIAGAASTVAGKVTAPFRRRKDDEPPPAIESS